MYNLAAISNSLTYIRTVVGTGLTSSLSIPVPVVYACALADGIGVGRSGVE